MNVGAIIRKLRKERGMTLVELAEKSRVALATLSRIENGRMTGTLDSHLRVAEALDLTLPDLYRELPSSKKTVDVKAKEAKAEVFVQDQNSSSELLITNVSKKKLLPVIIRLGKGGCTRSDSTRPGIDKFIYLIEGKIEVAIEENKYNLSKGDTIYFGSSAPHHFKNIGQGEARLLSVTSPPAI